MKKISTCMTGIYLKKKIQNIRNISKEYLHKDVNHFKPKDEYLTYSYAYPST